MSVRPHKRRFQFSLRSLIIAVAMIFIACGLYFRFGKPIAERVLDGIEIEQDPNPVMTFRPKRPFRLDFGRGSGWHGLDTIAVGEDGTVLLHRRAAQQREMVTSPIWEKASLTLTPEQQIQLAEAIVRHDLLGLGKAYHCKKIADGTQWALWIRQGDQQKAVYFNNNFPDDIRNFAADLDAILVKAGIDRLEWNSVPDSADPRHDRPLWDSIK